MSKIKPFRRKPVHPWLARIIQIDSPLGARRATADLSDMWTHFEGEMRVKGTLVRMEVRKLKGLLIKSASEAIRRSKAQLARKRISTKEKKEFREIVKIYANWLKKHRLGRE